MRAGACEVVVSQRCQVIVEGSHDAGFTKAIIAEMGIGGIDVQQIGGKDNLAPALRAFAQNDDVLRVAQDAAKRGDSLSIGIMRDADDDPGAAFDSVRGALTGARLPAPARPMEEAIGQLSVGGAIAGTARVAVAILPAAGLPGCLESLCVDAMAGDDRAPCVEEFFACLERAGYPSAEGRQSASKMAKARAHAFLSTMARPDLHVGTAAAHGCWPLGHPAFELIREFLRRVAA